MGSHRSRANHNQPKRKNHHSKEEIGAIEAMFKSFTPEQLGNLKKLAQIKDVAKIVERLEEEDKDTLPAARTGFNTVCFMFLALVISGAVVAGLDQDEHSKSDFLAYFFPVAAGFLAGAGVFRRSFISRAFMAAVILLIFGFISYLCSKGFWWAAFFDCSGYCVGLGILVFAMFPPYSKKKSSVEKPQETSRPWTALRAIGAISSIVWLIVWTRLLLGWRQDHECSTWKERLPHGIDCISEKSTAQTRSTSSPVPQASQSPAIAPVSARTSER